ncbi:hypothetical protein MMC16_001635 [Acarospora aff. strigata]|nr:hypothetical protein [Acarospora aff. strigata]
MVNTRAPQLRAISTSSITLARPRRITKNMISSPVSPTFKGVPQVLPLWDAPALEYISRKLQEKHLHITLIMSRASSDIVLFPAAPLDAKTRTVLNKLTPKAMQRFPIGKQWLEALSQEPLGTPYSSYLRHRSIIQNEILFSSEGLTLLNIDHVYTFKQHLSALSSRSLPPAYGKDIIRSVHLLHRITMTYGGRPLTKAYILRAYDHLHLNEDLLQQVCTAYESRYGSPGIVLTGKDSESPNPEEQARTFPRCTNAPVGPMTPNSASDITPTTKNEWEMLIMLQC